jgi:hypothetical protein
MVLLVVLGLGLCTCYVRETFQAEAPAPAPIAITNETLVAAGIVRPNVFNCANQIGITAEMSPLFASKNDL